MKKVMILSPFFYPELISTGKYNSDLAIQLSELSIDIEILCSHPLYPDWQVRRSDKKLNNIKIKRGGGWIKYPDNPIFRRLVLEVWFFFFVCTNVASLRRQDAIVAVLPPSSFLIGAPIFLGKTKIIGIVHDLQAVHLSSSVSRLKLFLLSVIKFVERSAFRVCDSLIYLSNEMKKEATEQYGLHDIESHIVYPFLTIKQFVKKGALAHLFCSNSFNIVYSGALGDKQAPQGLFEMAEAIIERSPKSKFIFFSRGPAFNKLKQKNNHDNIIFNDLVDENDLGELLLHSDIQLIPQAEGTSKGSLPSKLPNILASGTKIFSITDKGSELQMLLSQQKGCYISNSWDPEHNADKLLSILSSGLEKVDRIDDLGLYQADRLAKIITNQI